MKRKIQFDIWDYMDIDAINDLVCETINNGVPSDISYSNMKITKNTGHITMTADFEVEKFDEN
jgi:hypothetical protein